MSTQHNKIEPEEAAMSKQDAVYHGNTNSNEAEVEKRDERHVTIPHQSSDHSSRSSDQGGVAGASGNSTDLTGVENGANGGNASPPVPQQNSSNSTNGSNEFLRGNPRNLSTVGAYATGPNWAPRCGPSGEPLWGPLTTNRVLIFAIIFWGVVAAR